MSVVISPSLNLISLCTGGGGLDLGFELAVPSARTICMVEREAFAVSHLVAAMEKGLLHPAAVWSDARTFNGRAWRGAVDGVIGGIPCQPHSLAGRKQGSFDTRDLWSDARRIVVQARPWLVVIENVAGMLAAGADEIAGAERVWRDLRKLGFSVEIGLFTAAEVGASHERERVFILGMADHESKCGFDAERPCGRSKRPAGGRGGELADACSARLQGGQWIGPCDERVWPSAPTPEFRGASLVHAQPAERWPNTSAGDFSHRHDTGRNEAPSGPGEPSTLMADTDIVELRREPSTRKFEIDEQDSAFGLFPPGPADVETWQDIIGRAPHLEPAVCRMADGLAGKLDTGRVDRLRMLGNGVVPLAAAHAIRTLCHRLAQRGSAGAASLVRMMSASD